MVKIEINGMNFEVEEGKTVLEVANENNIEIPTLCYQKSLSPYGACRLCVVEILRDGWSKLAASCTLPVKEGLRILTDSERINKRRKMTIELFLSYCPEEEVLLNLAETYGVGEPRFKKKDDNCIFCGLCVQMCERMGVNAINFQGRGIDRELGTPYMDLSDVCITCGACASICPTSRFTEKKVERTSGNKPISILSEFDEGMGTRKPIYISFPQSVPKIPVIDQEKCVYYQTGNCKTCEQFCDAGAITYDQKDEIKKIDVGSVILSPGLKTFNPVERPEYGYGKYKNVITSLEFERLLNASGPTKGHIIRPSDGKVPKKIAFIQCVGSRDHKTNPYCSSVCCTYAIKEAVVAREHSPELESTIFAMDARTFGGGFEDYRIRAEEEYGIKFIKSSRIPRTEETDNQNLIIRCVQEGKIAEKEFDMVVLSVGLEPAKDARDLAKKLGIDLNEYGFCLTSPSEPLSTTKPGIFVSGAFSEPKDIPETVAQASGAAAKASGIIASERNTLIKEKEYPPEIDVAEQEPRIGVFVCHCGINIGGIVDVPAVAEYAKTLPNVMFVEENLYTCSQDTQQIIKENIKKHRLNRVVVASCTPRTHEPLFQDTIREAGLNPYLFEMANIRDQCSWVHMKQPKEATEKSKELVRMAVAKSALLQPLRRSTVEIIPSGMVIGGGLAGMTAALEMSKQGYKADLIEKTDSLGGNLNRLVTTLRGEDPKSLLKEVSDNIEKDKNITIHTGTELQNLEGYVGNFKSTLTNGKTIDHGVIIVATGAVEYQPTEYQYGKHPNIMTQLEFEHHIEKGDIHPKTIGIIHCVGARDDNNSECGRICCSKSIKSALEIKKKFPEALVFNIFKDIRTYGFKEKFYQEAAEKGVIFIRREDEHKPIVSVNTKGLEISVKDMILDRDIVIKPDIIVLSTAVVPNDDNKNLAKILKVPLAKSGYFLEAHVKLRPLDFATDGIYVCGLAQGPKFIDEAISQACGAVSRACTILSKKTLEAGGIVSSVDEEQCGGCGTCETICPYNAITVDMSDPTNLKAKTNEILCKGCGTCIVACPERAITMKHFSNKQIMAQIIALSEET